jgi:hypothetical protein
MILEIARAIAGLTATAAFVGMIAIYADYFAWVMSQ